MKKIRLTIYIKTWLAFMALVMLLVVGSFLTWNQLRILGHENDVVQRAWNLHNVTSDIRFSLDASLRSMINAVAYSDKEEGKKILENMSTLRDRVRRLESLHEATAGTVLESQERQTRLETVTQIVNQIDESVYEILRLLLFAEQVKQSDVTKRLEAAHEDLIEGDELGVQQLRHSQNTLAQQLGAFKDADVKSFVTQLESHFPDMQQFRAELSSLEASFREKKPRELIQQLGNLVDQLAIELKTFSLLVREDLIAAMQRARQAHRETTQRLIVMGLVILSTAILLSFLLARHLTRPIEKLTVAAGKISLGQFEPVNSIKSHDEIGELASAFNFMAQQLKDLYARLDKQVQEKTEALFTTNTQLEKLFQSITDGLAVVDKNGNIIDVNEGLMTLLEKSRDQVLAKNFMEACFGSRSGNHPVIYDATKPKDQPNVVTREVTDTQGKSRVWEWTSFVLQELDSEVVLTLEYVKDVTERKILERHVFEREKLASLGVLAAGMAHEIRNPLGILKSSAGMIRKAAVSPTESQELGQLMVQEVDRLNQLITSLLDFAKPGTPSIQKVDIRMLIAKALKWTEKKLENSNIATKVNVADNVPSIKADADQLHQVLLNLILNAIDAMPKGGALTFDVCKEEDELQLAVEDTGCGMDELTRQRIFEPFYTSKEKGVGLGLSIVYRIIERHHGRIDVESQKGKGTRFIIVLPVTNHLSEHLQKVKHA